MGVDFRLINERKQKQEKAREQTPRSWLAFMDEMVADIGRYNAEMANADRVIKRIDAEKATLLREEPDAGTRG